MKELLQVLNAFVAGLRLMNENDKIEVVVDTAFLAGKVVAHFHELQVFAVGRDLRGRHVHHARVRVPNLMSAPAASAAFVPVRDHSLGRRRRR